MNRVLFSKGAKGEIVRRVQRRLNLAEKDIDGVYGKDTADAITRFQTSKKVAQTGEVDVDTWGALMQVPVPAVKERALQLTACFEGHGFSLAQGNFDGAGITWGIIGFTLGGGELGRILKRIDTEQPGMLRATFGDVTEQLLEVLDAPPSDQIAFADSISLGAQKAVLAEPWLSAFRILGELPEVQQIQLSVVDKDYFQPAVVTASKFKLTTELGIALAFDIHVQNGGIKPAAAKQVRDTMANHPSDREQDVRVAIANAVADNASNPRFREDVRQRKLTVATGSGQVHGGTYVLRNWGLAELNPEGGL